MTAVSEILFTGAGNLATRHSDRELEALNYADSLIEAPLGSIILNGERSRSSLTLEICTDQADQLVLSFRDVAKKVVWEREFTEDEHPELFEAMRDYSEAVAEYNRSVGQGSPRQIEQRNEARSAAHRAGAEVLMELLEGEVEFNADPELNLSGSVFAALTFALY